MEEEEIIEKDLDYYKCECERLERELIEERRYMYIDEKIVSWLALNIDTDERSVKPSSDEIRDMLHNQVAVLYLLIWPIMEQIYFSGFLKVNQISDAARKLAPFYCEDLKNDLDEIILRFFDRYRNKNQHYRDLHVDRMMKTEFDEILGKKKFVYLQPADKIKLLLFVIYRYRNNIFHGNKDIRKWASFDEQIKDCLIGMMKLMDCMKKHKIVIAKRR